MMKRSERELRNWLDRFTHGRVEAGEHVRRAMALLEPLIPEGPDWTNPVEQAYRELEQARIILGGND